MIAIATGDIINSRLNKPDQWISYLREILEQYGSEPKKWEIFRGNSFQLALAPEQAMLAAIHIKNALKQTKRQDVRMAIGLEKEEYSSSTITEANGSAYISSGECFESLKNKLSP